jgi:uncharacterized RDD family membrane protein YckC
MTDADLTIRTGEGVTFALPLAGPLTRFIAWLVDGVVSIALGIMVAGPIGSLGGFMPDFAQAMGVLVFFASQTAYGIGWEWFWRGQTPGKRLLGLRVMDADGLRLQFGQILLRNLLRVVDALPLFYMVGGVACVWTRHSQRLGDLAANTVVIRVRREFLPNYESLKVERFNSLRAHPHLMGRLRQRVTPSEAVAAVQALLRRDELEPGARVRLLSEMAAHFREIVAFPAESTEGLTDEAYLRAVVDVLFHKPAVGTVAPPRSAEARPAMR